MGKIKDLTGQRFGRLVVVSENGRDKIQNVLWLCRCDCGNMVTIRGSMLRAGRSKSCGCFRKDLQSEINTTHGLRNTRLHRIWSEMKTRCYNKKNKSYEMYGGRGIIVCEEWLHNFQAFYDWAMANGYRDDLTIDRINNDKGYSPDNCRWITQKEQQNNRRNNRTITHNGETHTISEWAEIYEINPHTLRDRIESGIVGDELFDKKDRRFKKSIIHKGLEE